MLFTRALDELTEEDVSNVGRILIAAHAEPEHDYPMRFAITAESLENRYKDDIIPTLWIKGIEVEGSSEVVEASLDTVAKLAQTWHVKP